MKSGTKNIKQINESIERIENLTIQYKRKRMSEENYIRNVHEALSKMTSQRNYVEYLSNIGQI